MTTLNSQTPETKPTSFCNITKSNTMPQTKASIAIPSQPIEQPSAWMQDGTSPAEIILAVSFIIVAQSIANWSIAGIIYSLKTRK